MKKIIAQAWKEFMLFRRDKLLILLAVLMPIVLMSLAGGTQSLRLRNVPLLVYDYDNTALSRSRYHLRTRSVVSEAWPCASLQ